MKSFSLVFWILLLVGIIGVASVVFVIAVGPPPPPAAPGGVPCTATAEVCNGIDDNCNGLIDDGVAPQTLPCTAGVGACARSGVQTSTCTNGVWGSYGSCNAVPGNPVNETCNGIDDNCDGSIDNIVIQYALCVAGVGDCVKAGTKYSYCSGGAGPLWSVCSVVPGNPTTEVCDGRDNNCDGQIDENLTRNTTCGIGVCAGTVGIETCSAGVWVNNTCNPFQKASAELCNDTTDKDCDGLINEGCPCKMGDVRSCGQSNVGECKLGTQTCTGNQWSNCTGNVDPSPDICDGKDNNCNGVIDENLTQPTTCGVGVCSGNTGFKVCSAGKWVNDTCNPLNGASPEVCDGHDNNCNGFVDENLTMSTTCGVGVCSGNTGFKVCSAGVWVNDTCNPFIGATNEICNGKDDNCNGFVDENLIQSSTCGLGVCASNKGFKTCAFGVWTSDTCNPFNGSSVDLCNDTLDNNCNGFVNEGCPCVIGTNVSCGQSNVGECKLGTQTCTGNQWGPCIGNVTSVPEVCDGKDNDCDGVIDNGLIAPSQPCSVSVGVCAKTGTQIKTCTNTASGWSTAWGNCSVAAGSPSAEICDNLDNDCDGFVDENLTMSTTCGLGVCAGTVGIETCSAGVWVNNTCNPFQGASAELCNDTLDNNCDGAVNEGCACITNTNRPCGQLNVGECKYGIQTCVGGQWGTCVGAIGPSAEICDGKDNDCDGVIDEENICAVVNSTVPQANATTPTPGVNTTSGVNSTIDTSKNASVDSPSRIDTSTDDTTDSASPNYVVPIVFGIIFLVIAVLLVTFFIVRDRNNLMTTTGFRPSIGFNPQQQYSAPALRNVGNLGVNNYNRNPISPMVVNPYVYRQHQQYLHQQYLRNKYLQSRSTPHQVFQQFVSPSTSTTQHSNVSFPSTIPQANIPQRPIYPSQLNQQLPMPQPYPRQQYAQQPYPRQQYTPPFSPPQT